MRKKIEEIRNWLSARRESYLDRKVTLKDARLRLEARSRIQVREFGGELFVCFNDTPLLTVEGLKWDIPQTLDVMREQWVAYQKSEAWDRK